MQKVYLLLRNNQQTGPFSLEELIQFDLKPVDLIWIEGKSAGWYYPQEIKALHPHLPFLKQTSASIEHKPIEQQMASSKPVSKTVYVSMPGNNREQTQTTNSTNHIQEAGFVSQEKVATPEKEEIKTTYAKSLDEVESSYMNWVYDKKKKKAGISRKGFVMAALILVFAAAAFFYLNQPAAVKDETAAAIIPTENGTVGEEIPDSSFGNYEEQPAVNAVVKKTTAAKKQASNTVAVSLANVSDQKTGKQKAEQPKEKVVEEQLIITPPLIEEQAEQKTTLPAETTKAEAPKEKKKLKEKIFDLFKKKPDDKKEETTPADEEKGQRSASHREAGSNLAQFVTVRFTTPNDWMMGIKGAKATLTNKSGETISKAVVQVVYYNDDNEVLDKKSIVFGNIKSKQQQTVSIPDHATATRLEYSVISATGNEPFARL